ncbi:MAG: hypothetical protein K2R93_08740 [Gemmatimonadaceae bacterium]|nr:hypothetical protein [Gemmatimonadaceae bacterium]
MQVWSRWSVAAVISAVTFATPVLGRAQAYNYPSLQTPQASTRDYTAALVGGAGTTLLFQWREGASRGMHWQLDAGLADPKGGADPLLFVGGGLGKELARASAEQPLDVMLTAGVGAAFGGNNTVLRIPVGVSVGHRFALDQGMAITPYVHPRASVDVCSRCGGPDRDGRSTISLNFDAGALWQVTRNFGVVTAASFSGSDVIVGDDTFAIGVRWTPASLAGTGRR